MWRPSDDGALAGLRRVASDQASAHGANLVRGQVMDHSHVNHEEEWYVQRVYNGIDSIKNCVEVDPARRGGVPVLRGTRVTAAEALAEIADSGAILEVAENFDLDPEALRGLLNGISLCLGRPYQK